MLIMVDDISEREAMLCSQEEASRKHAMMPLHYGRHIALCRSWPPARMAGVPVTGDREVMPLPFTFRRITSSLRQAWMFTSRKIGKVKMMPIFSLTASVRHYATLHAASSMRDFMMPWDDFDEPRRRHDIILAFG